MSVFFYYSSGSRASNNFNGKRNSIGGFITDTFISNSSADLFGSYSNSMFGRKFVDYKLFFLKNTFTPKDSLRLYFDLPEDTQETNPENLSPVNGDRYIVPKNATGAWEGKDYKWATYDGSEWSFKKPPLANFSLAIVQPQQQTLGGQTLDFVQPIANSIQKPLGVVFNPYYSKTGDLLDSAVLGFPVQVDAVFGVWVKREIRPFPFLESDLEADEGSLQYTEEIPLVAKWDD